MFRLRILVTVTTCALSILCLVIYLFQHRFSSVDLEVYNQQLEVYNQIVGEKYIGADEEKWLNQNQGNPFDNYGDGSCSRAVDQKLMVDLLKQWIVIAEELSIKYSLAYGSLLGAWRDGQMIPYDTDMDVYIDIQDMEKLEHFFNNNKTVPFPESTSSDSTSSNMKIVLQRDWRLPQDERQRIDCKGQFQSYKTDKCSFQEPVARLLHKEEHFIDVFAYDISFDTVHGFADEKLEIRLKDFFPLSKCMFMNIVTYCPRNPFAIIRKLYNPLYPLTVCKNRTWVKLI